MNKMDKMDKIKKFFVGFSFIILAFALGALFLFGLVLLTEYLMGVLMIDGTLIFIGLVSISIAIMFGILYASD